jgi:putative spermidine/putrescine transport system permease protein
MRGLLAKTLVASLAALLALPVALLGILSTASGWAYPDLAGGGFTWAHWRAALGGPIGGSLLLSLLLSASVALLCSALGFGAARQVMAHPRRGALLRLAYYPYLMAPVVLGTMLQFYFVRAQLAGTLAGVAAAQALFVFPYATIFYSAFWNEGARRLEEQALTLGATPWQAFRRALMPQAVPWLQVGTLQCFLISWFEYGITQCIGVGKVATLPIAVMQYVREANPFLAAAAACLMSLPPLALLLLRPRLPLHGHVA